MSKEKTDLLQGTLDMLILKVLQLGPMHGFGISILITLYNELLSEFQNLGAQLLGISVNGVWCHSAFSQNRKLRFPLLADFEPKGAVARLYGVYRESDGTSERALFVIDVGGVIRWS